MLQWAKQPTIQGHDLSPDDVGGKPVLYKLSGGHSELLPPLRMAKQLAHSVGQRAYIIDRHKQSGFTRDHDLTATRYVSGHHRASACCRLKKR